MLCENIKNSDEAKNSKVLILVLMEDDLRVTPRRASLVDKGVLILVLMEDALRVECAVSDVEREDGS